MATGLSSFDISEAALIASASRTAKWITRCASLEGVASLFLRFVYSVEHDVNLSGKSLQTKPDNGDDDRIADYVVAAKRLHP